MPARYAKGASIAGWVSRANTAVAYFLGELEFESASRRLSTGCPPEEVLQAQLGPPPKRRFVPTRTTPPGWATTLPESPPGKVVANHTAPGAKLKSVLDVVVRLPQPGTHPVPDGPKIPASSHLFEKNTGQCGARVQRTLHDKKENYGLFADDGLHTHQHNEGRGPQRAAGRACCRGTTRRVRTQKAGSSAGLAGDSPTPGRVDH